MHRWETQDTKNDDVAKKTRNKVNCIVNYSVLMTNVLIDISYNALISIYSIFLLKNKKKEEKIFF